MLIALCFASLTLLTARERERERERDETKNKKEHQQQQKEVGKSDSGTLPEGMWRPTLCHGDPGGMGYVAHPQGCQEVLGGGGIHDESQHHYTSTVEQDLCVCVCVMFASVCVYVCKRV